jgi:Domain of unknown function (DUF4838)
MMRGTLKMTFVLLICLFGVSGCAGAADQKLVLVQDGVSLAPIVIFKDAPLYTRRAADDLAAYIQKTSGAKPKVIEGEPDPIPEHAIWVGFQPKLKELFPKVNFNFKHPEEILIAANANHLVIAGRDRWDPKNMVVLTRRNKKIHGKQLEFGTANAVYTFLQDNLGVRWLWPGELGEDIAKQKTIAFAPFQYRYHPQIRARGGLFTYSKFVAGGYGTSHDWTRFQRLRLDSLELPAGHAFVHWYDRFHKAHPEYFALQPDGSRSGFPRAKYAKLCLSNAAVPKQWLADVEDLLKKDPNQRVFSASPNDGWDSGHCICKNCSAWDHPDGEKRLFRWKGIGRQHVALSDRQVTFANHCARLLKERYPDKNYFVLMQAYGHSRPPAIKARPDDNVVVSSVANFLGRTNLKDRGSSQGTTHKQQFAGWGKIAPRLMWRPNVGSPAGWQQAQPDISTTQVIKDFKFVAKNNCIGIFVDTVWEHWAPHGPQYYVMAQLTWNPQADGQVIMADYYSRAYGAAVDEMKAYWSYLETVRTRYVESDLTYGEVYNRAFFDKAYGFLDQAFKTLQGKPDIYRKRVAFVRVGLDYAKLAIENRTLMIRVRRNKKNLKAANKVRANWKKMEQLCKDNPYAINWKPVRPITPRMKGLHPDSPGTPKGQRTKTIAQMPKSGRKIRLAAAEKGGWKLAFADDFDRKEIGKDWRALEGDWSIKDGALVGSGMLISTRRFPGDDAVGFQRMEFDVTTHDGGSGKVSDMSSFLHVIPKKDLAKTLATGYFFQFGGYWNRKTQLRKAGNTVQQNLTPQARIIPGRTHHVAIENNKGRVRFFLDGRLTLDHKEKESIVSSKHQHLGFYFYTAGKVSEVRVYVKKLADSRDLD